MNYNYEEWKKVKQNGIKKFIFDKSNFTLIFLLIVVFAIANFFVRKILILSKEFLLHFIFIIMILIILSILTQLIKWNTYKNAFDKHGNVNFKLIKFYELLIGILSLWIPIGILTSTYGIDYGSTNWKFDHLNINYILKFINYISINCILWIIGGILFELLIVNADYKRNRKNNDHFIIINKYI